MGPQWSVLDKVRQKYLVQVIICGNYQKKIALGLYPSKFTQRKIISKTNSLWSEKRSVLED
jgi:hypothetical protein